MPFSLKMSKNAKSTARHLKYSHISISTNLLLYFKCLVVDFIYIYIYIYIYIIYLYNIFIYKSKLIHATAEIKTSAL